MRVRKILDFLFPPRCVLCGKVLHPGEKICGECAAVVRHDGEIRCIFLRKSGKTIQCIAPFRYRGVIRRSLIRFKFYGQSDYADYYAEAMAEELQALDKRKPDAITYIPTTKKRKGQRGYDQAEILATRLSERMQAPCLELLERSGDTREQHKLTRVERRKNIKGAFRIINPEWVEGKFVLLVDDITTTGATLCEG